MQFLYVNYTLVKLTWGGGPYMYPKQMKKRKKKNSKTEHTDYILFSLGEWTSYGTIPIGRDGSKLPFKIGFQYYMSVMSIQEVKNHPRQIISAIWIFSTLISKYTVKHNKVLTTAHLSITQ